MPIGDLIKNLLQVLNGFFTILKICFWMSGTPLFRGVLGPGLAGLCLKTALLVLCLEDQDIGFWSPTYRPNLICNIRVYDPNNMAAVNDAITPPGIRMEDI